MAQPLTKKDRNGTLYVRPTEIDAVIDAAVREDRDILMRRARIQRRSSAGFLPLECLVHLIRDARRRNDENTMSDLMPILLGRCEAILRAKITPDDLPTAEDVRGEILGEFAVLFAEDGQPGTTNTLDFFECRFYAAFRTFRLPFIKRERDRTEPLVAAPVSPESDDLTDEEFFAQASGGFRPDGQAALFLKNGAIGNTLAMAIEKLPADQKKALILYYRYGYPEESNDPSVTSVASLCGVTGRTIRNRLRRAVVTLSQQFDNERRHANEPKKLSDTA